MRLYHQLRSRSSRVLWMLEESGLDFELTLITRDQKSEAWYRALHPRGRSPVIDDGTGPVFESAAICLAIADAAPDAQLIGPVPSHERALAYQWCFFAMTELEAPAMQIALQFWSDGEPDHDLVAREQARLAEAMAVLGAAVEESSYLIDDRFSVADVVAGGVLVFIRDNARVELAASLTAYCQRLEARPARQRALAVKSPA
jgi:glutathione S-transferase